METQKNSQKKETDTRWVLPAVLAQRERRRKNAVFVQLKEKEQQSPRTKPAALQGAGTIAPKKKTSSLFSW